MPLKPDVLKKYKNRCFVETGTYLGEGVVAALQAGFTIIRSVELDPNLAAINRGRFAPHPDVQIHAGDSGALLGGIIRDINEPITFWLDAHNSSAELLEEGKNCPLLRELEQIKNHPINTHTILIDDIRCCGTPHFDTITKDDLLNILHEINPEYEISYEDSADPRFKQDVLVAQIRD
tara:strand:- start:4218 stop:4751 length:534 start_codon:yes stop_codon:yes gene_type:complete